MISKEDIENSFWNGDPYLTFNGPVCDITPKEFIPLIDTIRKESDWRGIFSNIKKDKNNNYKPIYKNGLYFGFNASIIVNDIKIKAIETGKKYTQHPSSVYSLITQGCSYNDFTFLSPDVIAYCEALIQLSNNELNKALEEIEKAFKLQPKEHLYATLYFEIRLDLKDETSINEELKYFENDIDSLVHTDRVYKIIRFYTRLRKNDKALQLINKINQLLDDLIEGKRQNKIFGSQKSEWYIYKKEQFNKKIEKINRKWKSQIESGDKG